jgi:hypothetical protein
MTSFSRYVDEHSVQATLGCPYKEGAEIEVQARVVDGRIARV